MYHDGVYSLILSYMYMYNCTSLITPTTDNTFSLVISRRRRRPGDGRYCNALRPSVHLSVCPSVTFSFRTVTQKRIAVFSRNFAGTCTKSDMGVCCIVFDIDGMLFEFFMNFIFFLNFMFSLRFMLFPTLKNSRGQWESIRYIQYNPLFPCSDFWSQTYQMWGWFGGGGGNIFLAFYAISNISRKNKFWEYKTKYFFV